MRVLCAVRWPVGGIRTYLKYTYPLVARDLPGLEVVLVVPAVEEIEPLRADLASINARFVLVSERCGFREFAAAVGRELGAQRFDLIHSHGFTAAAAVATRPRAWTTPHMTTLHDILQRPQFRGVAGWAKLRGLRLLLSTIDVIQPVGEDARDNLLQFIGPRFERRVHVVRNGIAPEPFFSASAQDLKGRLGLADDVFLVGFFGRFMAQKGFRHLIEAIRMLEEREPGRYKVVAFGGGSFIREDMARIERMGISGSFHFLPFSPDVGGLLKSVDVVAIPSLWEAMPLLPMEAMVSGAPIVGTDCIGLKEALQDSPARIVPAADAERLAAALAEERAEPRRAAAAAFVGEAARRFSVQTTAHRLGELMRSVARKDGDGTAPAAIQARPRGTDHGS